MDIKNRIKSIRGSLSQKDFAEKIGVHITTVQGYESGNLPKGDILQRIHEVFNASIDWLLTGEGAPYINEDRGGDETILYTAKGDPIAVHTQDASLNLAAISKEQAEARKLEETKQGPPGDKGLTPDEMALIRTLRLCGEDYKKRVYIAATVRAQNVIEKRKLETKEKLNAREDLETLSTASIE